MSILITGSTGVIGREVLAHLKDGDAEVRALTRSPEKANFDAAVTAVKGDLTDIDSMRAAMQGVRTLFLLASNAPDELTQVISTLNVARDANVEGIVYLSVFKGEEYADVPHFTSKFAVERMIERCDLPATILRPAYFIQNDLRQKDALLKQGVYGMPVGDRGISMVDVRDIGDAAARELLRRDRSTSPLARETYALVGPDALDGRAIARSWSEVLDRTIEYGGNDLVVLEQRLRQFSPPWLANDMVLMMRRYQQDGAVASRDDLQRLEVLLGRPPRAYRDFARETAAEWTAA